MPDAEFGPPDIALRTSFGAADIYGNWSTNTRFRYCACLVFGGNGDCNAEFFALSINRKGSRHPTFAAAIF